MELHELAWDARLVEGFHFECRTDCTLCCYTTPAVTEGELRAIEVVHPRPEIRTLAPGRRVLASRPQGGACQMLRGTRCSVHSVRPSPCSMFPITVHGGPLRWQASMVLTCPGISLEPLVGWSLAGSHGPAEGLAGELEAARGRAALPEHRAARERDERLRRRRVKAVGADVTAWDAELLRAQLRRERPQARAEWLPGEPFPTLEDGEEYLPLVWEAPGRVVGIEGHTLGARWVEFGEEGPRGPPSEVFPLPRSLPPMRDDATRLLEGYLRYWLERDALFDQVLLRELESPGDPRSPLEMVRDELGFIGATVVTRAVVRARGKGDLDRILTLEHIRLGIQATDMDLLDRPSVGVSL